jgi:hypothetical protein
MSSIHRRLTTFGAVVAVACTASQAAAFGADLRSPDTRDLAAGAPTSVAVDLRAPDRSAPPPARSAVIDGRAPDSVDRAAARRSIRGPVVSIVSPRDDFDWGAAGIGAGGKAAVVLLGLGAALVVTHRRRAIKAPGAAVH